ncbi:type 1 glutamine amidotransferase [Streptomyces sp. NPDC002537]
MDVYKERRVVALEGRPGRALVLTHVDTEPPGVYGRALIEMGWEIDEVRVTSYSDPEPPAELSGVDALIVMGGPGSVSGLDPSTSGECRLIADAVSSGVPYWGVCLGAQLLAASTGGACVHGDGPEVGHVEVALTGAGHTDPVLAPWAAGVGASAARATVMAWHSDTFRLPPHAQLLAGTDRYAHAFRVGRNAYGIQFHLEVTPDLAEQWLLDDSYRQAAERALGREGLKAFLAEHRWRASDMEQQAHFLMRQWLAQTPQAAAGAQADRQRAAT